MNCMEFKNKYFSEFSLLAFSDICISERFESMEINYKIIYQLNLF